MAQILTHLARQPQTWNEATARDIAIQAEDLFQTLGLRVILEHYRNELLKLQAAYIGLSALVSPPHEDEYSE
jgi:hypothetical protein